jgi:small subunit ribosomal protein S7
MAWFKKPKSWALVFADPKVEKFINYLMKDGKKATARKVFTDTMNEIKAAGHMNPKWVLFTAIDNAAPSIMVKSKRVWGSVYQVPVEVNPRRKIYFACTRLLDAARGKKWKPMSKRLSEELLAAYNEQGNAVKKKEDVHKMAEANKAFAYMAKYVK